jgi:DNA-binding Xre family transcriptional regulator
MPILIYNYLIVVLSSNIEFPFVADFEMICANLECETSDLQIDYI